MKKLVISTLAVLAVCPAFAGQSSNSSWQLFGLDPYIGIHGGASYTNLNYKYDGHKESITDTLLQGHAALGLEVCDKFRSEIEWSIFTKTNDHADFGDAGRIDVDAKLQTLLWNSYWEFGDYKIVRPFVGVGLGLGFVDVKHKLADGISHSHDYTRFSAMGTVGLTFDMEHFAVDVAARYNYVGVESGMHNFGGDVGIRFMF